jgi:hypothetical protein
MGGVSVVSTRYTPRPIPGTSRAVARPDFPRTVVDFQALLASEEACRGFLAASPWFRGSRSPRLACHTRRRSPTGRTLRLQAPQQSGLRREAPAEGLRRSRTRRAPSHLSPRSAATSTRRSWEWAVKTITITFWRESTSGRRLRFFVASLKTVCSRLRRRDRPDHRRDDRGALGSPSPPRAARPPRRGSLRCRTRTATDPWDGQSGEDGQTGGIELSLSRARSFSP